MATQRQKRPVPGRAGSSPPKSRRLVVALVGLVVLLGAGTWFVMAKRQTVTAAEFRGGARLAVDKDVIDFGTVKYNQRVHASFRLRNVGDRELRLPSAPPVEVVEGC
jgi:hypothetical protein